MNVIDVEGVSKAFRIPTVQRNTLREHVLGVLQPRQFRRLQVLKDVSFSLKRGEALGIMGRNGCGKSTLLKIVCGVYQPDAGRVVRRAPITPILELGVGWHPELDAIDNVCLIGSVMGLRLPEIRKRMDAILAFAELESFASLKVKHYSSGMAARLSYAIAFEAVREVLVLDEVFAVGDAGFKAKCEERYQQLRAAGHTIVLVSHSPDVIEQFCDHAILLEGGQIEYADQGARIAERYLELLDGVSNSDATRTPTETVEMGDLRRTEPFNRTWGYERGRPIDRYYIEGFLSRHATDIHGRVLEAGTSDYTVRFGGANVRQADVLNLHGERRGTTIIADLQDGTGIPDDSFDCVILTQVLPYIFDVDAAVRTVHRILRPGGVFLVTVPGITHAGDATWAPQWCWSFTPVSLRRLLNTHFASDQTVVETHGNVLSASSLLYGLATEDLSGDELDARDEFYHVTIAGRAVKG